MSALDQFDAAASATPYAPPVVVAKGNVLNQFDTAAKSADAAVPQKNTNTSALGTDWQNFAAGAGKAVTDLGRGAKQLMDIPAQYLESKFPGLSDWSQSQGMPSAKTSALATNADVAESRATDAPLMNTKAGIGGNIVGNIATTMLPLGIAARSDGMMNGANAARALLNPSTYKAAAAAGAANGALQPITGDDSRAANIGIGAAAGVAGNAVANTIGRIAQPVSNVLSTAHQKAVSVLENAGIPLDAAQKSGSAFLGRLRSSLSDNPFTNGAQKELAATQQAGYNKAVLNTVGENATAATPEVMNAASSRINGVFQDVLNRNNVNLSDSTLSKIATIQRAATEEEKTPVASIANRLVGSVQEDGTVPGQVAYNIKKDLDRLASSPDTTLGYHAKQLRSTLMDTINDSLSPADQSAFSEARSQFSNMKRIEGTIDKNGNGDISPSKLANVMSQIKNRGASVYGRGDQSLVDLAHSGNMLLPDKLPQSGSIPRMAMQMAVPLAAGGAQGAYTGDWEGAAKTAAGLYAIPKAAQYLMNKPATSDYLSRGMTGAMTPLRNLLEFPQTNQIVGGSLRRLPDAFNFSKR